MKIEARHLCMSGKRFNFTIGTNPEPWLREPSEHRTENIVADSLHKKNCVLYLIDTTADISLGASPSSSTYGIRPKSIRYGSNRHLAALQGKETSGHLMARSC